MFDTSAALPDGAAADAASIPSCASLIRGVTDSLAELPPGATAADMVDTLTALEELKCAAEAAQARTAAAFDAVRRREQAARGLKEKDLGKGIAHEIALARRESPVRGRQHLGLGKVLVTEMPHTLAAMTAGRCTEHRARILARETACLSLADRQEVDRRLAADPDALVRLSDKRLEAEARKLAARLDPQSVVDRKSRAERDRTVTLRPAPDTMTYLTGLLPVAQGVAVWKALGDAADSLRAAGDDRSRGQIMADTLVSRVTGLVDSVDADTGEPDGRPPAVPLTVNLVMTDRDLFAADGEPARLDGYGTIPGALARDLVHRALGQTRLWLRRLFTHPTDGQLAALDSRSRIAPAGLADFVQARDAGVCRNSWCGAPIRHVDHVQRYADGGATSAANSQGLCESCNYAAEAPGWFRRVVTDHPHTVETATPTGHVHRSSSPPLPGAPDWPDVHDPPLPDHVVDRLLREGLEWELAA